MFGSRFQTLVCVVLFAVLGAGLNACTRAGESLSVPAAAVQDAHVPDGRSAFALPADGTLRHINAAAMSTGPAPNYHDLILQDGATVFYQLSDLSATLTDSGPNHVSGVYGAAVGRGAQAITAGVSTAAHFPGGTTYNPHGFAFTPKTAVLQVSHPTLEAWFSLRAGNTTHRDIPIIAYGTIGRGARYGLFVHGLGGGQPCLEVQLRAAGQPAFIQLSNTPLRLGTVYHVAVTFNGTTVATFINGNVDNVAWYLGSIDYTPDFSDGLQIGGGDQAPGWGSASFPGTIAQAAVYGIPLFADQIEAHYLAGRIVGMTTEAPAQADSFVDSIGVNTHFDDPESLYGRQFAPIAKLLIASGIRHVRAGITYNDASYPSEMQQLAAGGVHASYVTQLGMTQAQIEQWPGIVGSSFEQYEAPNEQDDVGNSNWLPDCVAFQKRLYGWVKSDPQLARYPVLGPSIVNMNDAQALGDLSAYMDEGNIHDYFGVYNPGTYGWGNTHPPFGIYGSIAFNLNIGRMVDGTKPIEATETGYGTIAGDPLTLDYRTHLRYMTRLFFEQFNNGITRSYSYELMDEGGSAVFNNFGLITTSLQPKPALTAIASIISELNDPGPAFATTPLTYEISGSSDRIHHTLLQKRNGQYVLAIWLEVPGWVTLGDAGGDIIVPAQTVTLATAKRFTSASLVSMDENGNTSSQPLGWNGTSASISLTDKVSLVDLTP